MDGSATPPTGLVAFLFTDVVGSTRSWADHPDEMERDLAVHDALIREHVGASSGFVFYGAGDSFGMAFSSVWSAIGAAVTCQRRLAATEWALPGGLSVRMGIHVGEAVERDGDYFGTPVNVTARLMSVAHGGQVVVSEASARLIDVQDDVELVDLGAYRLRDVDQPLGVFQVAADGLQREFPALRTEDERRTSLPRYRSSFVGRRVEIDRIRAKLADHALVTVTGVGGAGKTRVAVEVAAQEAEDLDGAYFVDLQSVDDPDAVATAFAGGLELAVPAGPGVLDEIRRYLEPRRILLVVDNCEHLLDALADVVDELLSSAAGLKVLATSRESLEVEGEETYRLPSLSADEAGLRLFVERAHAADDRFELDASNRGAVVELVERLDGMPLAIELAASRVRTMSLDELAVALDDRFTLLRAGRQRGRMQRQRTLEAAIEWSYDLLSPDEQAFFRRLGVFAGPFLFDLVPGVTGQGRGDARDLLDSLVAKSLVTTEHVDGIGTVFRLLETLRAYSISKLVDAGEVDEARAAHEQAIVDEFGDVGGFEQLRGVGLLGFQLQVLDVLAACEHAVDHARPANAVDVLDLAPYSLVGNPEFHRLAEYLDRLDDECFADLDRGRQARLRGARAGTMMVSGDIGSCYGITMQALAEYRDVDFMHRGALYNLALILVTATDADDGEILLAEALHERNAWNTRDSWGMLEAFWMPVHAARRDYRTARTPGLQRLSELGDGDWSRGVTLSQLGWIHHLCGESVELPDVGLENGWSMSARISQRMCGPGDLDDKAAGLVEIADRYLLGRIPFEESEYLVAFGRLAHLRGDDDHAMELMDAATTRSPWIIWAMVETIATIEGWPDHEWKQRRTDFVLSRQIDRVDDRDEMRERGARTLHDELARWATGVP